MLDITNDIQHLLDIAASADAEEGIRQGLEDAKAGKLRPARQFFDVFDAVQSLMTFRRR